MIERTDVRYMIMNVGRREAKRDEQKGDCNWDGEHYTAFITIYALFT